MTSKQKAACGTIGAVATIWVGSFATNMAAASWAEFPTLATSAVVFIACIIVAIDGFDNLVKGK